MVVVVLLTSSGGGKKKLPPPAHLPALSQTYVNSSIGVTGGIPRDWSAVRGRGTVELASHDAQAIVVIAAQAIPAGSNPPLLSDALARLRATYGHYGRVQVKHAPGTRLGGLTARSIVAYALNQHHVSIRALIAAAVTPRLAYLLEAFTSRHATVHDLAETQEIVTDVRLKP